MIRARARDADLVLSAHTSRHTCLTRLVRGGADVVLVAELAGHRRLETTRRYSLPSHADRQDAMERLRVGDERRHLMHLIAQGVLDDEGGGAKPMTGRWRFR